MVVVDLVTAARVNHGPCKQCGAPVVYQGAEYCSPRCQTAAYQTALCALCRAPIPWDKQLCEACSAKGGVQAVAAQVPSVAQTQENKSINSFRGVYSFLSNFYAAPTLFEGLLYPTSEHAYQAAKSEDPRVREAVRQLATPAEAKQAGKRVPLKVANWDAVKTGVMREVVRDKFVRNPDLGKKLVATGSLSLVEGNTWGDRFWGVCGGVGENWLGRILMEVREELRSTIPCSHCGAPTDSFLGSCPACASNEKLHCELCRAEIPEGKICSECYGKVPVNTRPVLVLDVEAELITDEVPLPPLVCVQLANASDYWIFHVNEAKPLVEAALRSNALIVGHYVAFDMAAICAQWPDLMPLVFQAYEDDRVTDTMLREKLVDIAMGAYFDGIEYPLEKVARTRCGITLKKGDWQLRFRELKHLPVSAWPEEARHYAIADVVAPLAVYHDQERDRHWLLDQYRQARASFVLELMSAHGLHTDATAVSAFKRQLETKYAKLAQEMIANGLMRFKGAKLSRNTKAVQARVEQVYAQAKKKAPPTPTGRVKTDADTCEQSGDALLKHYADLSSTATLLSTYVPLLERATATPLHVRFTSLLSTGRTSTSPNVQNAPTDQGVRECFVPRPGYVYIVSDYAGIELRTWAQICWGLFQHSKMREALNAGVDPHTLLASKILDIPYERAVEEYARDRKGRVYLPRQAAKACFHPEVEVLTRKGWTRIDQLTGEEDVCSARLMDDGDVWLEWERPQALTVRDFAGELVHLRNEGVDLRVTPDHRMCGWKRGERGGQIVESVTTCTAEGLGKLRYWANGGLLAEGSRVVDERLLRLAVAVQADGSYAESGRVRLGFTKQRKIERLRSLLREGECEVKLVGKAQVTFFYLSEALSRSVREFLTPKKTLPWWWTELRADLRRVALEEARFWDSHSPKRGVGYQYASVHKENVDVLQALAALTNAKTRAVEDRDDRPGRSTCFVVGVKQHWRSRGGNVSLEYLSYTGPVYCLTTRNDTVLVRDGGVPIITRQCNFGRPGGAGLDRWRDYARSNYGVDVPKDDPEAPIDAKRLFRFWGETWTESEPYAEWCSAQCEAGPEGLGRLEQPFVKRFRGGLRYTELSNSGFQGLASDLFKEALWLVTKACYVEPSSPLFGSRPVNEIHDEIVTETPDNGYAHEAAAEQERLMLVAARKYLPDITNIEAETLLARRWSKAAKPMKDAQGRLIPWDLGQ